MDLVYPKYNATNNDQLVIQYVKRLYNLNDDFDDFSHEQVQYWGDTHNVGQLIKLAQKKGVRAASALTIQQLLQLFTKSPTQGE